MSVSKKAILQVISISSLLLINACSTNTTQIEPAVQSVATVATIGGTTSAFKKPLIDVTAEYLAGTNKIVADQIMVISKNMRKSFKTSDKQLEVIQKAQLKALSLNISLLKLKRNYGNTSALNSKINQLKAKSPGLIIQPNFVYYLNGKEATNQRSIPQYALKMTGLDKKNTQGKGIKIALIDTPIDAKHPVFKGASIKTYNFVQSKGKRHATAIAGILIGQNRIKGVAPRAELISIGAFNEPLKSKSLGLSTSFVLGKSFDKAMEEDVDIINLSFGSTEVDPLMKRLAAEALSRKIVLVSSVGNDSHKTGVRYPAALKGVYAITAIDARSKIYKRANTGNPVDYALPGVGILTSKPNGKYTSVTGTSFANAYASGLFALELSKNKSINRLNASVLDLGQKGKDRFFGRGLLRLSK